MLPNVSLSTPSRVLRTALVLPVLLVLLGLLGTPAPAVAAAAPTASAASGPRMTTSEQERADAVHCYGNPRVGLVPVLLVHGTGGTATRNWGTNYLPELRRRGHAVCTVDIGAYSTGDIQDNVQYVATAIRMTHAAAGGRKVAVLGHSQGGYLPRAALRLWPDLVPMVDDVIGLAGVYDIGSTALTRRCASSPCYAALFQLGADADLVGAFARRPLPAGPSYSNIGTLGDPLVTPQPAANQQRGASAVEVQDVCPGRTMVGNEHGAILGDSVALALVLDALDHRGAVRASRVSPLTCLMSTYPGYSPPPLPSEAPGTGTTPVFVTAEPPVRCYLRPDCTDVAARGRMVVGGRISATRRVVTWTGTALTVGNIRLRVAGRSVVRTVQPGKVTLSVRRPAQQPAERTKRRDVVQVETMPRFFAAWGREQVRRVG